MMVYHVPSSLLSALPRTLELSDTLAVWTKMNSVFPLHPQVL
jgi:hypothetical protein